MSHVDDGKLNALLDGELNPNDARAVEAHLSACGECRRRLEEARAFLRETGALLESLGPEGSRQVAAPASFVPPLPQQQAASELTPVPPEGEQPRVEPGQEGPAPLDPKFAAARASAAGFQAPQAGRVSKTLKEVAVSIDGRTEKTPAIQPVFPHEAPPRARPPRAPWDLEKLAWAASLALALGVGYLANEVYHMRHSSELAVLRAPDTAQPAATTPPTPTASAAKPAEATKHTPARARAVTPVSRATGPAASGQLASRAGRPMGAGGAAAGVGYEPASPRLVKPPKARVKTAPGIVTPRNYPIAGVAPRAAAPTLDTQRPSGAPAPSAARAAEAASGDAAARPAEAAGLAGAAERRLEVPAPTAPSATSFRRVTLEEAVRLLSGSLRQMEDARPIRIEAGSGRLVSGADPARDVVRVTYTDRLGREFRLDQQSSDPRTGPAFNGLMPGDTLVTADVGSSRVRWIDRRFWLSLVGPVPADQIKAMVARVR